MARSFTAACVQNCAGPDMEANLERAVALVREARSAGADLIATPEFFSCLDIRADGIEKGSHPEGEHPALRRFTDVARETGAWILLGSLAVRDPGAARDYNRSYLIDDAGGIVAHYDKVHMFDVDLGDDEQYRESNTSVPGERAVLASTPWCTLGLTVCYDLRFAYLYRALAQAGAEVLTCPAAFTRTTGEAHWHALVRARAIETGSFVLAPCQSGRHGERETYGHSLIVDPWGVVLAEGDDRQEDVIYAEIEPARAQACRRRIPALQHDRAFAAPEMVNADPVAGG